MVDCQEIMIPVQRNSSTELGQPGAEDAAAQDHFTFVLLHGAFHGIQYWSPLQEQLRMRGHDTVTPLLDAENLEATTSDDLQTIHEAMQDCENPFFVGHSRGAELVPYLVTDPRYAEQTVGVALISSGGPHGLKLKPSAPDDPLQSRYTEEYSKALGLNSDGLQVVDLAEAPELFYHDVDSIELVEMAVADLRLQRPANLDEVPPPLPAGLAVCHILGKEDKVLNLERARMARDAQQLGRIVVIEGPWGHTPQLSQPEMIASLLVKMAVINKKAA